MSNGKIIGAYNNSGNTSYQNGVCDLNEISEKYSNGYWMNDADFFFIGQASTNLTFLHKKPNPGYEYENFTSTANVTTTWSSTVAIDVSPTGDIVALGGGVAPFLKLYKRNRFNMADTPTLSVNPPGSASGIKFSPDGTYLAIAHTGSPYVSIYKRSGDTFTKLTNPTTLPISAGNGCDWSPDGTHLAVVHSGSPYVTIYSRSGDTFTKLANPTTLPAGTGNGCGYSSNGHLAVAHTTTPFVTIYSRSGDTYTKLTDPTTIPTGTGWTAKFSPDGNYMAVGHSIAPFLSVYSRSGNTYTKLANTSQTLTTQVNAVDWRDNKTLCSGSNSSSSNTVLIFDVTTGTPVRIPYNGFITPSSVCNSVYFKQLNMK